MGITLQKLKEEYIFGHNEIMNDLMKQWSK